MIPTKYIIAPYEIDPQAWANRVAFLHQLLADNVVMPCVVVSAHANILAGCYGDDPHTGLPHTLAQCVNAALVEDSELIVITFDNGHPSEGVASQLRVWRDTREEMGHALNVFAGAWQQWLNEFDIQIDPFPNAKQDTQPDLEPDSESDSDPDSDLDGFV